MALSQKSKILVSDITSALAGKQDALGYTPIKTVNNVSPNSAGNVTISATPTTVKGVIGSAVAANSTSMTLPSGGTWFVWNAKPSNYNTTYSGVGTYSRSIAELVMLREEVLLAGVQQFMRSIVMREKGAILMMKCGKLAAIRIA